MKTRVRVNLSDAVDDTAPNPPPCFLNRASWIEYLKSAAASQNHKGEQVVILMTIAGPAFNLQFNYCEDCTQIKSVEMMSRNRCKPKFLTPTEKPE